MNEPGNELHGALDSAAHRPRRGGRSGAGWWVAAAVLGCWVLFHFAAVALSVMPPNSLSSAAAPATSMYLQPLFGQGWKLFAPNPVVSDIRTYARGIYRSGNDDRPTPWLDLSGGLREAAQHTPFSSRALAGTVEWAAALTLLNALTGEGMTDAGRSRLLAAWADTTAKPAELAVLEAAAASALAGAYPSLPFHAVQVAVTATGVDPDADPPDGSAAPSAFAVFYPAPFQPAAGLR